LLFYVSSLAVFSGNNSYADASEWRIYFEESNGNIYFFDASRVNSKSNLREVWTRIRYKASVMGASSYQSLIEVDCSERAERTVQRTFFSDKHWEDPAMSTDMKSKPKRSIREGSATERLSEILCAP
jgi:predicted Zn-dependent protease